MFAKGVAVNPTYVDLVNILSISLIFLFIVVGSSSSALVLTDALSASSSITKIGSSTFCK